MSKKKKIIVVGVDGASFNYIDPLVKRGILPNFGQLLQNGSYADLNSVVPWQTPVAWTSYATGVNPGMHGIYGWWSPDIISGKINPSTGKNVTAARFWENLSSHGLRIGVVNVPMSYPARPINGFYISGFDSPWKEPEIDPAFAYPRTLIDHLKSQNINYRVLPEHIHQKDPMKAVSQWEVVETNRVDAAISLWEEYDPDFMQVNLFLTDYIAHRTKLGDEALDIAYKVADTLIGRLFSLADEDTIFFVVSDHGSCRINKFVMIHNLLQELDLLHFKPWLADEQVSVILGPDAGIDEVDDLVNRLQRQGGSFRESMYQEVKEKYPGANIGFSTIDWDKTKVYCTSDYGQVKLNRERGSAAVTDKAEELRILNRVREVLAELKDPESKKPLVESVLDRDYLYNGHLASNGPDLTPILNDNSYYFCQVYSFYHSGTKKVVVNIEDLVDPAGTGSMGDHQRQGIFLAHGRGIEAGKRLADASILDLAPTILHEFGIEPLPEYEGNILGDLFGNERTLLGRTNFDNTYPLGLRERLKSFGYKI